MLRLFRVFFPPNFFIRRSRFKNKLQIEGISWDGGELRVDWRTFLLKEYLGFKKPRARVSHKQKSAREDATSVLLTPRLSIWRFC